MCCSPARSAFMHLFFPISQCHKPVPLTSLRSSRWYSCPFCAILFVLFPSAARVMSCSPAGSVFTHLFSPCHWPVPLTSLRSSRWDSCLFCTHSLHSFPSTARLMCCSPGGSAFTHLFSCYRPVPLTLISTFKPVGFMSLSVHILITKVWSHVYLIFLLFTYLHTFKQTKELVQKLDEFSSQFFCPFCWLV